MVKDMSRACRHVVLLIGSGVGVFFGVLHPYLGNSNQRGGGKLKACNSDLGCEV